MATEISVTEAQVLAFRARRGHVGVGDAPDAAAACRAVVGIQAQVEGPALWAIALRTEGRPTFEALRAEILEDRRLVRIWAQRDTLHLYAADDWRLPAAMGALWAIGGRRGAEPTTTSLEATRKIMRERGLVTRTDLLGCVTKAMIRDMAERTGEKDAPRYAAGRLVWRLSHLGEVCFGPKKGSQQTYALRTHWLPDLAFDVPAPEAAALALVRRYLRVAAPATAQDIAHFLGARVPFARGWVEALAGELVDVRCGERSGLVALAEDADALVADDAPPPPRLLAAYDTLLMSHADKSWTVPDEAERPLVWKRSAVVAATVLHGGRIVGTWTHKKRRRAVDVTVTPHAGWPRAKKRMRKALEADAAGLAQHLGVADANLTVA